MSPSLATISIGRRSLTVLRASTRDGQLDQTEHLDQRRGSIILSSRALQKSSTPGSHLASPLADGAIYRGSLVLFQLSQRNRKSFIWLVFFLKKKAKSTPEKGRFKEKEKLDIIHEHKSCFSCQTARRRLYLNFRIDKGVSRAFTIFVPLTALIHEILTARSISGFICC